MWGGSSRKEGTSSTQREARSAAVIVARRQLQDSVGGGAWAPVYRYRYCVNDRNLPQLTVRAGTYKRAPAPKIEIGAYVDDSSRADARQPNPYTHGHSLQAKQCMGALRKSLEKPYRRQNAHSQLGLGLKASRMNSTGKARTCVFTIALGQSPSRSGSSRA